MTTPVITSPPANPTAAAPVNGVTTSATIHPSALSPGVAPSAISTDAEIHELLTRDGSLNVATLAAMLVRAGLLDDTLRRDLVVREGQIRARLLQSRRRELRDPRKARSTLHAAELILSEEPRLPGAPHMLLNETQIFQTIASFAGLPFVKIDPLKLTADQVMSTLPRAFATRYGVVTLARDEHSMRIALSDPWDRDLLENLRRIFTGSIEAVIATRQDIQRTINEFYGFRQSVEAAQRVFRLGADIGNLEQYIKLKAVEELEATDRYIVKAVEYLLRYAFEQRASDIHIEPKRNESVIRMRIDGVLHNVHMLPKTVHAPFVSRIKMLARMDIAEKRKPQDGRIKTGTEEHEVELRISTLPTAFGEKIVIRIFDPKLLVQDLDMLGFFPPEREQFMQFIGEPNGLVLVTGPTGSGKTTTLYTALRQLAQPEVNIVTIEDPIEIVYEELNQTAIHPKIGITFGSALRNILRQDPDIIMVGEIRDEETAENAVQAALTGHLVLSTLHTNDAPTAVARMIELGVKPYLLASTLTGVIAQRLVRKVCPHCAVETELTPDQMIALDIKIPEGEAVRLSVKQGEGCAQCRGTGYTGRTGVFEVLPVSHKIRKLIHNGTDSAEIMRVARLDGMMTLRECAIKKLAYGETSFEEVVRVTTGRVE